MQKCKCKCFDDYNLIKTLKRNPELDKWKTPNKTDFTGT